MSDGDEHGNDGERLQLRSSESEADTEPEGPSRRAWTKIDRSTVSGALEAFRETLPTTAIDKCTQVGCTIDHLLDRDYRLARAEHKMQSRIVFCRSERCARQEAAGSPACSCRYKFKSCLTAIGTCEVFQQGEHIMAREDPPTPKKRQLSGEMKDFIVASLDSGEKTTATKLYACIVAKVHQNEMAGPAPTDKQVADFVKNYRRDRPTYSMQPMIELCNAHLYDNVNLETLPDDDKVILCDNQRDARPGADGSVSQLGDGSKEYPLRVGMTCLRLVRDYVSVQNRSDCTTMFHLDSTHSMVINGYLVFAFGYSDRSGHFYLLAYFCTSQKRAIDIGWCIRSIKRVCMDVCGVEFSPQFVMMDADKAQFNACTAELRQSTVLMCWFHVLQNVWKHAKEKGVGFDEIRAIFAEMYDMHYSSRPL